MPREQKNKATSFSILSKEHANRKQLWQIVDMTLKHPSEAAAGMKSWIMQQVKAGQD